jgi:hypothetical protein
VSDHSESHGEQHLCVAIVDDDNDINKNDCIWVQFITKKDKAHYDERTESTSGTDYDVLFVQWCRYTWKLIFLGKMIEVLYQEKAVQESFLHQFKEKVQYE